MEQACNNLVKTSFYDPGSSKAPSPYDSTKIVFLFFDHNQLVVHDAVLQPMKNLPSRTPRACQPATNPGDAIVFPVFRIQVGHALVDYLYGGTFEIPRPGGASITDAKFWASVFRVSLELYALATKHELKELERLAASKVEESSSQIGTEAALRIVEACTPLPSTHDAWFRKTIRGFLVTVYGDLKCLVRCKMSGLNNSHAPKKMFRSFHLFMDIMVELEEEKEPPPGTAELVDPSVITVELGTDDTVETSNIFFLDLSRNWFAEEMRLADYVHSRRYGGDEAGGFAVDAFGTVRDFGSKTMTGAGFGAYSPNS